MIRLQGLTAGYGTDPVLRGIDLSVADGEFIGILGPNACGKSTLVRILSGVLRPWEGTVEVGGLTPAEADPRALARRVATVPQTTEIPFPFTGEELVTMGRYPHLGRFESLGEADRERVATALRETDTEALARRFVPTLSGGERQRLLLARALVQDARLLLLDEATAAMDVHRKIDAFDLLAEKNRQTGLTVLAVLHDLNLAALYCRRLILMRDGCIVADGAPDEVFTAEILTRVYDTPVETQIHAGTGLLQAIFLPRRPRTSP